MAVQHECPGGAVLVFGSANADTTVMVHRAPGAGETVTAASSRRGLGGKGANQAVAAARAGAFVRMVGAVGADQVGAELIDGLARAGVDVTGVLRSESRPSGTAFVVLEAGGENRIVVDSGANGLLSEARALEAVGSMRKGDVLVLQTEVPTEAVAAAIRTAEAHNIRTVVNLAPVVELGALVHLADPLVVNEIELSQILRGEHTTVGDIRRDATLVASLARSVVVTLGAEGAVVLEGGEVTHVPATQIERIVDTTGAGDSFVGVLAARLAAGDPLARAAAVASEYAGAVVGVLGAADAYPPFMPAGAHR